MSAFEYVFTFYSVMLGLAAANVATGFADMWRDRRAVAVGVCTPLLALIVLLGVMNLWLRFWSNQEMIDLDAWQMIYRLGMAMPFVFLSRAMFPGAGGAPALEEHYLAHRRVMLLALAVTPAISLIWYATLGGGLKATWNMAWILLRVVAPLALLPFPGRLANRLGLSVIAIWLVVGLFR